jgi:hypothetical protein
MGKWTYSSTILDHYTDWVISAWYWWYGRELRKLARKPPVAWRSCRVSLKVTNWLIRRPNELPCDVENSAYVTQWRRELRVRYIVTQRTPRTLHSDAENSAYVTQWRRELRVRYTVTQRTARMLHSDAENCAYATQWHRELRVGTRAHTHMNVIKHEVSKTNKQ